MTIASLPSPTWRTPNPARRRGDRFETIELTRLEMLRIIHVYRSYVGPRATRSELTRIIEDLAA